MRSRTTKRVVGTLAISGLVGVLAWWGANDFWVDQASRGARSVLLAHRAMHLYAMRPALFASNGTKAEALESVSPSALVREQYRAYKQARFQMGLAPVSYRIASDNPLNPANRADEGEAKLISLFNTRRDVEEHQTVIEREGKSFLLYVLPFSANTPACLQCHGDRAQAPVRLQEHYPGPGGYGERPGRIRAVESVILPLATERLWTVVGVVTFLVFGSLLSGLVFANRWLSRRVRERTAHLERETVGRQQAEEALRITQFAVDLMPDTVYRLTKDGTIVYANQAGARELGYTREEMIGKLKAQNINDELVFERWEKIRTILKGKGSYRTEGRHRRKDGSHYPVEVCVSHMRFGEDGFVWVVARDLTLRKHLEAQVIEAQKMEAIGILAGGIAHDFNNILGALHGFAELARESLPEGSAGRDDIEQILVASTRARALVCQILDFSRRNRRDRLPTQVGVVASEALKLLRATLPATIAIRDRIDLEPWAVVDPTGFHQIVMNLCTNAFQVMSSAGGVLEVDLLRVEAGADAIPTPLLPGPCVHLRVRDSGPGIPPEVLGRVFEPYFTTRGLQGGTGLGLSVVHGIVTSYGGLVTVRSELGQGTTFDVWLPATQSRATAEPSDSGPSPSGDERILIVDDEDAMRNVCSRLLKGLGYSVQTAASPEEALELFRRDPSAFDLILTDQTMPNMTGLVLIGGLRGISANVKIVLMSGYSPSLVGRSAGEMGINAILNKPFTRYELAAKIHAALRGPAEVHVPET